MTNNAFPAGKDPAFLFGCGRFRMEAHLLENCAGEILRFGKKPLLVCDATSRAVAFDKISASLAAAGAELRVLQHDGYCCRDDALALAQTGALDGVDVVLGCGGGVICDFSKCIAHLADAPLVTIPTSSAQCCAYTPIAVCYSREGRYVSTSHFPREISLALLDLSVLSRQPPRLLAAGALDAMAKKIELEFWSQLESRPSSPASREGGSGGAANIPAPSGIAAAISDFIYADLDSKIDSALGDLAKGEPTETLRDVIFDSVVGAGIVSGIAGGSKQVALAHRFYFFAKERLANLSRSQATVQRSNGPTVQRTFTHGELVAVGLVMQHAYNGHPDKAAALAARLRGWGLAASVAELGLPSGPEELAACASFIDATKTMKAAVVVDSGAPARLREALVAIYR